MTTSLTHYDAANQALCLLTLAAPLDSKELEHIAEAARALNDAKQARHTQLQET